MVKNSPKLNTQECFITDVEKLLKRAAFAFGVGGQQKIPFKTAHQLNILSQGGEAAVTSYQLMPEHYLALP